MVQAINDSGDIPVCWWLNQSQPSFLAGKPTANQGSSSCDLWIFPSGFCPQELLNQLFNDEEIASTVASWTVCSTVFKLFSGLTCKVHCLFKSEV
jgi:hypothetical protein